MKKTLVISQPTYLPWLGYFELIARADIFVFLDHVQYQKRSWQSRNRLKGSDGEPFWLTVPVLSHPADTPICAILIDQSQDWRRKHLRSIEMNLRDAPHFSEVYDLVKPVLDQNHERLAELNIALILALCAKLGLKPEFLKSSELDVTGKRSELLANICAKLGATHYYSAAGSKEYMDEEMDCFDRAGISVTFQDWPHPTYRQKSEPFVSHLSAIDSLCYLGAENSKRAIYGS